MGRRACDWVQHVREMGCRARGVARVGCRARGMRARGVRMRGVAEVPCTWGGVCATHVGYVPRAQVGVLRVWHGVPRAWGDACGTVRRRTRTFAKLV